MNKEKYEKKAYNLVKCYTLLHKKRNIGKHMHGDIDEIRRKIGSKISSKVKF